MISGITPNSAKASTDCASTDNENEGLDTHHEVPYVAHHVFKTFYNTFQTFDLKYLEKIDLGFFEHLGGGPLSLGERFFGWSEGQTFFFQRVTPSHNGCANAIRKAKAAALFAAWPAQQVNFMGFSNK
jgi:hypothetical protein